VDGVKKYYTDKRRKTLDYFVCVKIQAIIPLILAGLHF